MIILEFAKKKVTPFLLILFGLLVLILTGQAIVAGALLVAGLSMIINWIWPEKWLERYVFSVFSISGLINNKFFPFLLLALGIYALIVLNQSIIAGACFVIGISMMLNWIWPEKWGEEIEE